MPVATNRELITRFEKKIQATLVGIWGRRRNVVAPLAQFASNTPVWAPALPDVAIPLAAPVPSFSAVPHVHCKVAARQTR